MTGSRSTVFLIIILLLSRLLPGQAGDEIDWKYEIDLLGKELAQRHSNLFFKTDSASFYNSLARIAHAAEGHSLFDISVQLQQAIARLGDAHTRINFHFNINGGSILPLECYWFEDGIYVLRTRAIYSELLGKKLTAINGHPMDQIVDSMSTLIVSENPYLLKSQFPRMLTWTPLLVYFGFAQPNKLSLEYRDSLGLVKELEVTLSGVTGKETGLNTEDLPLSWKDQKSFFRDRYYPEDRIYYIQYNKCWSREVEKEYGTGASALFMPSFKEFEKKVFQTIKKQNINKLVFDMRFNGGGNSDQGTKFIQKLSNARFKGHGNFYVIVGRQTFSSAIRNTVDFMNHAEILLIGEGTGGRPNHFGDVQRFVLPESNLVVTYSTKYFKILEDDIPCLIPDILTPISYSQLKKGIDPAMEFIRNH